MIKRTHLGAVVATVVATVAAAGTSFAGEGYDSHTWQPIHDGSGGFTSYGSDTLDFKQAWFDATFDYARRPVVLRTGGGYFTPLQSSATTAEFGGAIGLPWKLQAGVAVPIGLRGYDNSIRSDQKTGVAADGIGDIRGDLKWNAFEPNGFIPGLAVVGGFSVPTGDEYAWLGSGAIQPSLMVVGHEEIGPVALLANVGYRFRPGGEERIWGSRVDDAVLYRAGAIVDTGFQEISLLAEAGGSATVGSGLGGGVAPFEGGVGVRRPVLYGVTAAAGVNVGLNEAVGTPAWRAFLTLAWGYGSRETVAPAPYIAPAPVVVAPVAKSPTPAPAVPLKVTPPAPVAPVKAAPRAVVQQKKIEINETIHFANNSYVIDPDSYPILDALARAMIEHPEVTQVRIDGHTDSIGNNVVNQVFSKLRANAVKVYLVKKGIDESRLETAGYGETKPLMSNKERDGRAMNRRVEFTILERSDKPK